MLARREKAFAHAKHGSVGKLVGAFGRSEEGVEFDALDAEPVHVMFLLLSSPEEGNAMMAALGHISRILRDSDFARFLRQASGQEDILDLLREGDERAAPQASA